MLKRLRPRSAYDVIALLALFVALSGSAYAIGKKTVGTKQLKPNAVTSPKVKNASLLGKDFAPGQLPVGPQGPQGAPGQPGTASSPAGAVSFFNLAACPSGWTELVAARGRYIVGLPAGGALAGTVGTALTNLENRPVGQHTHAVNDPGHTHEFALSRGETDAAGTAYDRAALAGSTQFHSTLPAQTGITINPAGSVAGTNAPYIQLRVCQKS